jgi:hypothetical protein
MNNRYAANCKQCNKRLAAGEGICQRENNRWVVFCASNCNVVAEPVVAEPVVAPMIGNEGRKVKICEICEADGKIVRATTMTETADGETVHSCAACAEPVVVAEPVVATSKRDIKIGEPDTLSDKARVWAKQIQYRLVADLFSALDSAFAQTIGNDDLNMVIDSMLGQAEMFVGGRYNASFWIDSRNDKISAADILRYAAGVDYSNEPACFLRVVFSARAMQDVLCDVAAKNEIEAERVAQEAARRAEIAKEFEINAGLNIILKRAAKISQNYNTTETRVFTLLNKQTGNAYTYAVSARNGKHLVYVASERGKSAAIFCGSLDSNLNFSVASNGILPAHSKRLRALVWLFSHVAEKKQISSSVEILDEDIIADCNADGCKFTDWPAPAAVVAEYDELGEEISYASLLH